MDKQDKYAWNKELEKLMKNINDFQKDTWSKVHNNRDASYMFREYLKKNTQKSKQTSNKQTDNINNEKLNNMNVGQSNVKEASKYTRHYKYSVKVLEHRDSDKTNYVFSMDNSFFNKILKKPTDRFTQQLGGVAHHSVVFKYKPKKERELIDNKIIYFKPFEIVFSTQGCHDFVYYHNNKNSSNKEVLKGLYILNLQKAIKKLKEMFDELHLSDKAKVNMELSLKKHLASTQSPNRYGVDGFEDFYGYSEEQALMILDDYDDGDLVESLGSYIID